MKILVRQIRYKVTSHLQQGNRDKYKNGPSVLVPVSGSTGSCRYTWCSQTFSSHIALLFVPQTFKTVCHTMGLVFNNFVLLNHQLQMLMLHIMAVSMWAEDFLKLMGATFSTITKKSTFKFTFLKFDMNASKCFRL